MKSFFFIPFLIIFFLLFPLEAKAQTIKKDSLSGRYYIQNNQGNYKNVKKMTEQMEKFKKISKLQHNLEIVRNAERKADSVQAVRKSFPEFMPEHAKILDKTIPIYKGGIPPKPIIINKTSSPLSGGVLINGKEKDTLYHGDSFELTFNFAPGEIVAWINIFFDRDKNGIYSTGDLILAQGYVMDNSDDDFDLAPGSYKLKFEKGNIVSSFISTLTFEVNNYQSVSSAELTVKEKDEPNTIICSSDLPLPNVLYSIWSNSDHKYIFTDSSGRFTSVFPTIPGNMIEIDPVDLFGITNGYIPPHTQSQKADSDTLFFNFHYNPAKAFIEGHIKDQYGDPVKNLEILVDGPTNENINYFQVYTTSDSTGHYKFGVVPGDFYLYLIIPYNSEYLSERYTDYSVKVPSEETITHDVILNKANKSVTGKVFFEENGVQGVPVYAINDSIYSVTFSGKDGIYAVPVLEKTSGGPVYQMQIGVAMGYFTVDPAIKLVLPGAADINFEFQKIKGGIKGRVIDNLTQKPIPGAYLNFTSNFYNSHAKSDENGDYHVSLIDGVYDINAQADTYHYYYESDIMISGNVLIKNIAMQRSGCISGIVKDENGIPIQGTTLIAIDENNYSYSAISKYDGTYLISNLSTSYKVFASKNGYLRQWYNMVSTADSAILIQVRDGDFVKDINFVLYQGGSVSGKMTDRFNKGIPDVAVMCIDSSLYNGSQAYTDSSGNYKVTGLGTGKYYVYTYSSDYVTQFYNGVSDLDHATLIAVKINENTPDIDFSLVLGSSISGIVRIIDNKPFDWAYVYATDENFNVINSTYTYDDSGYYMLKGLAPEKPYYFYADIYNYIRCWYNDAFTPDSAEAVTLSLEEKRNNINFTLHKGAVVKGKVTSTSGYPIPNLYVDISGENYSGSYTDFEGLYVLNGLLPGSYIVHCSADGFADQWYNHKSSLQDADFLNLSADQVIENIDFELSKQVGDTLQIKLNLSNIPDQLLFNDSYVGMYMVDYWWGVRFDADGDISTGIDGCEVEAALIHNKYDNYPAFQANILDGTEHVLLYNSSYSYHSEIDVRIDPNDKNTIIMSVPKFWYEAAGVNSNTRFYAHSYYLTPNGPEEDFTDISKFMILSDPVGDAKYDFIDIVYTKWRDVLLDVPVNESIPLSYSLAQCYPNPFNPATSIRYSLPYSSTVEIKVFNIVGQMVKQLTNEIQQPGNHEVSFNAGNLASGVYFYTLKAQSLSTKDQFRETKKMILMK